MGFNGFRTIAMVTPFDGVFLCYFFSTSVGLSTVVKLEGKGGGYVFFIQFCFLQYASDLIRIFRTSL